MGFYLMASALVLAVIFLLVVGRRASGEDVAGVASRKRDGWLVVIGSVLFALGIVVFTFAYDNPVMGRDVPAWIHTLLGPFVGAANLLAIYGTPLAAVLGLVAAISGRVPSVGLRLLLAVYAVLYAFSAVTVVLDAWFPRQAMGELSDLWLEILGIAVLGMLLFLGLLVVSWRGSASGAAR